jgi:hypothetical protein
MLSANLRKYRLEGTKPMRNAVEQPPLAAMRSVLILDMAVRCQVVKQVVKLAIELDLLFQNFEAFSRMEVRRLFIFSRGLALFFIPFRNFGASHFVAPLPFTPCENSAKADFPKLQH